MEKFEQLFAEYPWTMTDEAVKEAAADILANHFDENNNLEVWKQCLNSIDLTTLNGEDTTEKVEKMAQAVNEFEDHFPEIPNVAAMCVYPALVQTAADTLTEPIGIAAVAAGFPASQTFVEIKVAESAMAVAAGATEIDIVISIGKFLEGNYQEVFDEISEVKAAIQDAHLKVILETGALKTAENIYKASILAMAAGADFIKTSTGKVPVNATPEATYVMCQAIKAWKEKTGAKVCYKPAGGVSTTAEAVQHYTLVKEILGEDWLNNESFRFGASRLANNLLTSITGKEVKYF
ncbi:MAG: deoxyribose-phosphate aldolase [Paludibacteraceae bacterium]|jgi:deoxyribose-phosphate aldolase|nr:deoxyribose-phosphate aldolase [Paludibacteraceae bacterium]